MIESIGLAKLGQAAQTKGKPQSETGQNSTFSQVLGNALATLEQQQKEADQLIVKTARGGDITDLSQVMIATQKASLGLELTMQIRNRVVEAYQEIMRMQV
jgi:flagellar hook-basal body complex protein FliE